VPGATRSVTMAANTASLHDAMEFFRAGAMEADLPEARIGELDLLVVPSKREGMARVIVEAFSAGVPVIAFPAGGIPEVVLDGETGFLTRQFSAEALASRLRDVMGAPEALARVARNARQAWARLYTVPAYQKRITSLLEQAAPALPTECETAALLPHT